MNSPATSVKALLKNLVLTSISKIVHMAFNNNYRHSLTHSIHPNVLYYIAMVRGYLLFAYYTIYQRQSINYTGFNIIGSIMLMDISYCRSDPVLLEKTSSVLILLS